MTYTFLEPYTFKNGVTAKNRIVIPPMTEGSALYDGTVSQDELNFFAKRAGDAGIFISPVAYVTENGKGFAGQLSITDDKYLSRLSEMAQAMKKGGSLAILQIFHAGRRAFVAPEKLEGASAIASGIPGSQTPRELTGEEVEDIIKAFGEATRRAIQAGFDGVEIHGANHYLIHQFFSAKSNQRTDKWGQERSRFGLAIIEACRKAIQEAGASQFLLGYRFSPQEKGEKGFHLKDTLAFVNQLADAEIDYLHLSQDDVWDVPNDEPAGSDNVVKQVLATINQRKPLIIVGGISTPQEAQEVKETGAEFVALGMQYLREPQWVAKVEAGQEDRIRYTMPDEAAAREVGINPFMYRYMQEDLGKPITQAPKQ
ncbi:2,4-dienoyl-CoA reductase [Streptococcus gallolyticus]|uniref:2,4-dienoyl-CoA reductase n=2 Tax=Streptococcus gallolyticus TaxID=315405 RepID=A0A1I7F3Z6_9STRE|nr:NADH-dependent flavin oxidoreductase [Streptococcus gallolyticus]SFC01557.1 2,4-dienoyl-CoA reductase [Streptococcus gallolyticus]SFU30958.1 2,4-dienoyl-CoA reductase [Streptococcus gallolyticus]